MSASDETAAALQFLFRRRAQLWLRVCTHKDVAWAQSRSPRTGSKTIQGSGWHRNALDWRAWIWARLSGENPHKRACYLCKTGDRRRKASLSHLGTA